MRLTRILLIAVVLPLVACFTCTTDSQVKSQGAQGWSQAQKVAWYTASQGSRLVPKSWLHALDRADSATPFLDQASIARYHYLPNPTAGWKAPADTPAGCEYDTSLPLGFTLDCQSDQELSFTKLRWKTGQTDREPWVGMNCSACHTTVVNYQGKSAWIDGGPTLADFQSFTEDLNSAMKAASTDDAKFAAFSAKVLGAQPAIGDAQMLRAALKQWVDWNDKLDELNYAPIRYGYGRLDAIGHIFNKVALVAMPGTDSANQTANPSDAPVSFPFLWNIPQLNKVEWNGVVDNVPVKGPGGVFDVGALGRNTGEVIGVFGDINIVPTPGLGGYKTSVLTDTLIKMEVQLRELQPPAWPKDFPALDKTKADQGEKLYQAHCSSCHAMPTAKFNIDDKYTVKLSPVFSSDKSKDPVQTDFWMACNAILDRAMTGRFKGTRASVVSGTPLQDNSDSLGLLKVAAVGTILGQKGNVVEGGFEALFGINRGLPQPVLQGLLNISPKQRRANACMNAMMNPTADNNGAEIVYKGRPLQGVWATAPYLHNGSVPTLYDLLLPPAQRPASFYVGSHEFDPKKVGFISEKTDDNSFLFDTTVEGNGNGGHDYDNAALSDDDRWALVEYMKSK